MMQPMALNVTLNQWCIYCKKVTHDAKGVGAGGGHGPHTFENS